MNFEDIITRDDIPLFLKNNELLGNYLELGVHSGGNLSVLSTYNPKLVLGIDVWGRNDLGIIIDRFNEEEQLDHYKKTIKIMLNTPCIKILKGYSQDFVSSFVDEYFDYVYIDDDHSYIATKSNLVSWWPKIRKGGILSGHDCFNEHGFEVIKAVHEFIKEKNIADEDFYVTKDIPPSFLIVKK